MNDQTPLQQPQIQKPAPAAIPQPASKGPKSVASIFGVVTVILAVAAIAISIQAQATVATLKRQSADAVKKLDETTKQVENFKKSTGEADVDKDKYQAVFLKSGQVYFGKITYISDDRITLEDIYYLKTANGQTPADVNNPSGNDISLVKLGEELHGPEDKMFIERKEVNFWENLKPEGQVSKAIQQYRVSNPQ